MIRQTVLPFKLEKTNDLITPHAGLALLGEFAIGLGLLKKLDRHLPKPGSGAGYDPGKHLFPLMLMQNGGGRSLEDLRKLRKDDGLRDLLKLEQMPSSDATGDFLRRSFSNGSSKIFVSRPFSALRKMRSKRKSGSLFRFMC